MANESDQAAVWGEPPDLGPTVSDGLPTLCHSLQPVQVTCDGCGQTFELPITQALNRFTTKCPHCGWCAWLPRDCWPIGGKP
jgi:hypothetical protein